MQLNKQLNILILVLFFITLVGVIGQEHILRSTFTITPQSNFIVNTYADSGDGGTSTIAHESHDDHYQWQCILASTISYPYCGFEIILGNEWPKGMDFTQYTNIKLWMKYAGDAESIRLSLKNFDERYSDITATDDFSSSKFNELEIRIEHLFDGVEIDMRTFMVPTWWKMDNKVSLTDSAPEFNNVVNIDFQTGSDLTGGTHNFKLERLDFVGQWMSTENWYFSFMFLWFIVGTICIVSGYFDLNTKITLGKKREQELLDINLFLDSRTQELTKQTERDKLTGAFNRQGVEDAISLALTEWQEEEKPLSIIMLDIDHFKDVNDQYGHAIGDDVLTSLTKLVQDNIRSTDRFARWGGEEFVLVCRNTSIISASDLAENLRERISSENIVENIGITASFGVANIENCGSITALFKQADDALYRAKNSGRNKIEVEVAQTV